MLVDKQTYFDNHHHQRYFYKLNNLIHMSLISLFFFSAFNSAFFGSVATFLYKSALFMNPAIADLPTNSFLLYLCIKCLIRRFIIVSRIKIFRFNV